MKCLFHYRALTHAIRVHLIGLRVACLFCVSALRFLAVQLRGCIGGGTGSGGGTPPPTFSLQGLAALAAPTGAENKATTTHQQTTCYILHAQTIADGNPQFDVSFPGQLPKIVATRGEIFSLKFTKYRLAAGLRLDPLGELKRSPRPTSRNKWAYF